MQHAVCILYVGKLYALYSNTVLLHAVDNAQCAVHSAQYAVHSAQMRTMCIMLHTIHKPRAQLISRI